MLSDKQGTVSPNQLRKQQQILVPIPHLRPSLMSTLSSQRKKKKKKTEKKQKKGGGGKNNFLLNKIMLTAS